MTVEAVVRDVQGAPVEPPGEGQVPLQHGVPGTEPVEGAGLLGPEPGPVGFGPLVDARVLQHRPPVELLGGREDPLLGEVVLDGGRGARGVSPVASCAVVCHRSPAFVSSGCCRPGGLPGHDLRTWGDVHGDAPQPTGGGPLRWRGRDYDQPTSRRDEPERGGHPGRSGSLLAGAGGDPGRCPPRTAGDGRQRPAPHPRGHAVHHRGDRRAGPCPRHVGRPGGSGHRRQPLRLHRLQLTARPGQPFDGGPPRPARRVRPVPVRGRTAGHPPDRDP